MISDRAPKIGDERRDSGAERLRGAGYGLWVAGCEAAHPQPATRNPQLVTRNPQRQRAVRRESKWESHLLGHLIDLKARGSVPEGLVKVARQFTAWDPLKKQGRPAGTGSFF